MFTLIDTNRCQKWAASLPKIGMPTKLRIDLQSNLTYRLETTKNQLLFHKFFVNMRLVHL